MGHISPQTYRSMFSNMKNMSDNEIENLKNQVLKRNLIGQLNLY